MSAVAGFGSCQAGRSGMPGLLLHPSRICWPKSGWTLSGTRPEPHNVLFILCRTLLTWHRCREPPSLEVLRSAPIMRHLLRKLRPSDLAALTGSCRTAATTVKQELEFIQRSLEQMLHVSEANVAGGCFCVHKWASQSIQVPSPCGCKCLVARQDAASLNLEVLGSPASAARAVKGQLLGMPRWSGDSSQVAVAIALPQDADEESGPYAHTITQFSFWNTESQKWTSSYVNACFEDQCDLAMLYWAPSMQHGYWLAVTLRKTLQVEGLTCDNLLLLSAAGGSRRHKVQLATASTKKAHAAKLVWSADSSRIALVVGHKLWVRSATSRHQLLQDGVANNGQAVAWAPSGQWVLCQGAFVGAGLEQLHVPGEVASDTVEPVHHSWSVADTLAACLALTWGAPGVVAVTKDGLYTFSVGRGPILTPQHTIPAAFDATWGWVHGPATECAFDWAPDGQWLLCLRQLSEREGWARFAVLLVHPASGRTKSLPCHLQRAAKLSQSADMRLATASQWAPDSCSVWVGVADMDCMEPLLDGGFSQWLLRFK